MLTSPKRSRSGASWPALRATGPSFDLDRFRSPHAVDRPVPFYSWNEKMEPGEIRRQIDEMAAAGWGGVFVHSRIGLTTPYLGDEWFAAVDAALDQAKKKGLKVWLYDEDKWPSGYSGGTVPLASPDFRMKTLVARPTELPAPAGAEALGDVREGLRLYVWTAPLGHDWFNGTCYAGLLHREAMGQFIEDAYEPYYRRYAAEFGETIFGAFTDEPCAVFRMRLPEGSLPFTPQLIPAFQERFGYDPVPKLHLLYRSGPGAAVFRLHYYRVVNQLFEKNYTAQLGSWCEERGIPLTGHFILEDALYGQQTWGVMIMPNYRHMHIPGVDHLGRHAEHAVTFKQCQSVVNQFGKPRMLSELYGCTGGALSFQDRHWIAGVQLAMGVNLLNPHLSLYTMSGCRKRDYPQNIFYQQPWWPLNRHLDDRLSRLCAALQQGSYNSDTLLLHPGESVFSAWESRLDPEKFDQLLDWDVDPATPVSKGVISGLDDDFNAAIAALLGIQRGFDLGDETILADDGSVEASLEETVIRVGVMRYRTVLLPSMLTLSRTTLELLGAFVEGGGKIWTVGRRPALVDGEPSAALGSFLERVPALPLSDIENVLEEVSLAPVTLPGLDTRSRERVYAHVREMEDGDRVVYLVNNTRLLPEFSARVELLGNWKRVDLLDSATGETVPLVSRSVRDGAAREVDLPFAPAESHLLWLRADPEPASGQPVAIHRPEPLERILLPSGEWTAERLDDNTYTLDFARYRQGDLPWSEDPVPVLGLQDYLNSIHYDGPLMLEYIFTTTELASGRRLRLVVEYPDRAEIRVNGRRFEPSSSETWLDFRWHPVDISSAVVRGRNSIEITYPNFTHGDLTNVEDPLARYGTEIEAVYLVGDFQVKGNFLETRGVGSGSTANMTHLSQRFADGKNSSLWSRFGLPPVRTHQLDGSRLTISDPSPLRAEDSVLQGLPFYAGRLRWSRKLRPLGGNGKWLLRLEHLDCPAAEVILGGENLGYLATEPFEIVIPEDLRGGGHLLEIIFYGSLRNLLGPHHHPEGELCQVGPTEFTAKPPAIPGSVNDWIFRRAHGEEVDGWVDRYSLVSFGHIGTIELLRRL